MKDAEKGRFGEMAVRFPTYSTERVEHTCAGLSPSHGLRWLGAVFFTGALLIGFRVPAQSPPSPPVGVISCPVPAGVISWWPGDGDANDIVSNNNGTLECATSADAPGVVSTAFLFDGTNDYVSIPDAPSLHPTNLTIEAWVRCDSLDTPAVGGSYPGQQYVVFHQNENWGNFEGFNLGKDRQPAYGGTNDTWCFVMTSVDGEMAYVESQTSVQTNVWYHIAAVRGSNYLQLYVNGVLEAQTNVDFPVDYGNFPLYFASSGESYWDHKFAGALDEVALYDRALSSNEILAIYAAGCKGKTKTPTALSLCLSNCVSPALTIAGIPGQSYGIQMSSSPTPAANAWIGLTNLTLSTSADVWMDSCPATNGFRFYRVLPGSVSVP